MKKFLVLTLLILFLAPSSFAQTRSFKTISPNTQMYYYHPNMYNRNLPPPPPPRTLTRAEKRYLNQKYNSYNYNNPHYYNNNTRRRIKTNLGNFLGGLGNINGGQITGVTPTFSSSYNDDWDSQPYGYQKGWTDSNGNYYYDNSSFQSGASVRILD